MEGAQAHGQAHGQAVQQGQVVTVQQVQEKIDQLYGDRHAKDLGDGLLKGGISVAKGIFAGVGGLVAAPIAGAVKEGGMGMLKGTAIGLAGLVVLPTIGIVHGARQLGSGIANTPDAVKKMIDKDKNERAAEKADVIEDSKSDRINEDTYRMSRERVEEFAFTGVGVRPSGSSETGAQSEPTGGGVPMQQPASAGAAAAVPLLVYQGTATPVETEFYEVLCVESTATSAEIKKSYYKLAVKLHPDKNPGDETANDKFAALGEAYQILSDPIAREKYDKFGKEGLGEEPVMDAKQFFNMAFGTESFQPLIGELTVAHTAGESVTPEEFKKWQQAREKELAGRLLERLRPWLMGQEEEFVRECLALVEQLKKEEFAAPMLQCIGYTYYHKAEVCLGLQSMLGIPGYLSAVKLHGHSLKSQFRAVDAAVKIQDMKAKAEAGQQAPENALSEFLNSIWLITALDIESTLRHVVELVVMDKSLAKGERKKRALGIMKLGKIFLEA